MRQTSYNSDQGREKKTRQTSGMKWVDNINGQIFKRIGG